MAFNVREIFNTLSDAAVDYVVVGGFAVILHGYLRATADLDLVIGLAPDNCSRGLDQSVRPEHGAAKSKDDRVALSEGRINNDAMDSPR